MNEAPNIRKLCDEIFGSDGFVAELIWKRRASSAMADNNVSSDHEYVICYQKGGFEDFQGIQKDFKGYSNPDSDPRGPWVAGDLTVGMNASMRPNQAYDLIDPATGNSFPCNPNRVWAYIPDSMNKLIAENRILFPDDINRRPMLKRFQNELKSTHNPFSSLMLDHVGLNTEATKMIQDLMGGSVFDYSKPLSLLVTLLSQVTKNDDLVLDFFAGSSATAHAVATVNAQDGFNRRYIMVQLPEKCNENSEAYKAGYKNIAEISKERIRRGCVKVLENKCHKGWSKDIGFRALKIDSSNMADVYYTPDAIAQDLLSNQADNIKPDRKPEDLLFQVLLDWGVDLSLPIRKNIVQDKTVYLVNEAPYDLVACFDDGVNEALVKELAGLSPLRVVFRDTGFASDSAKINVAQIFKQLSPGTDVKSI
jgi:adenine-specific DNA-methyltransferase